MNNRTKIRIFTIIGVLLIFVGAAKIIADFNADIQAIRQVIEDSIIEPLKSEGYEVEVKYSFNGYKVYLTLSDEDNWFEYASWCGYVATDFLVDMKTLHADTDEQISEYHFEFLKYYRSAYVYSSIYYNTAYTTQYINDPNDPYVYDIKLALNKGQGNDSEEAKTYLEYLKEWSTHKYRASDHIVMDGEHYTVQRNDDDSYTIKPKTKADLEINPESTLMWYMYEYASTYFTFNNITSEITTDDEGNHIEINFSYTNNLNYGSQHARIAFAIYNEDGKIINLIGGTTPTLEANATGDYVISETYADEIPAYFKIAYVQYFNESLKQEGKYIVFE